MGPVMRRALLAALCFGLSLVQAQADRVTLKGAGATFPAPLIYKWMDAYSKEAPHISLSYDSVGSGDGISRFLASAVDFSASETQLKNDDATKVARGAMMVPATAGMIAIAYNVSGLSGDLRLPRDVYADIFLGKITRWDDPRLKQANPNATLPSRNIAVVARLDRSGTTNAMTGHLSAVSANWKRDRGAGSMIEWPTHAMLARGNEGVASRIKISDGSIGYVEYDFAKRLGLRLALVQNKDGAYVAPSEQAGQIAISQAVGDGSSPMAMRLSDPSGPQAYPIVTFSWFLLYRSYPEPGKARAIKSFIDWSLTKGQANASVLGYVPLPESLVVNGRRALGDIQ